MFAKDFESDKSLINFKVDKCGEFQEVCSREEKKDGKLLIRLSFAINTSTKANEQNHNTVWVVKLGFKFKTKLKDIFRTQDGNLKYAARFAVEEKDEKGKMSQVKILIVSDKSLEHETVSKE